MKRSGLWIFLAAACQSGAGAEDVPAPAASNIPRAAPSATGAAFAPPTSVPAAPGPSVAPTPEIYDPFRLTPPKPIGAGGGGTHL